ncbi:MAG: DNA methyltransferase, partial [Candidatus Nanohaloarchaea archaeon]
PSWAATDVKRKSMMAVPERFVLRMIQDGWVYRTRGVWNKSNYMPESVTDRLAHTWEPVYMFTQRGDYWWDLDAIRKPYSEYSRKMAHRQESGTERGSRTEHGGIGDSSNSRVDTMHPKGKNPGDVITTPTAQYPDAHYAVFPDELVADPIKASVPPRVCEACGTPYEPGEEPMTQPCSCTADGVKPGVVLDPFAGRGTVGKVAGKHGRRYVGIDLDPESVELADEYVPDGRTRTLDQFDGGISDADAG